MESHCVSRAPASRYQGRALKSQAVEGQQYGYKYYATVGCDLCLCDSFCILDVWPGGRVSILPSAHSSCLPGIAFHLRICGHMLGCIKFYCSLIHGGKAQLGYLGLLRGCRFFRQRAWFSYYSGETET